MAADPGAYRSELLIVVCLLMALCIFSLPEDVGPKALLAVFVFWALRSPLQRVLAFRA